MACVVKRRGKYVLDYYDQTGKRRWETTKGNKKEAELLLAKRLQEIDRGEYQSKADQPTFGMLTEDYLANRVKLTVRATTAKEYEDDIRRHILPYFGADRRVRTITVRDCEDFRTFMTQKGVEGSPVKGDATKLRKFGASTVNKCLVLLSMMFNYAIRLGWIASNPAAMVTKIKTADHGETVDVGECVLDAGEIEALLAEADDPWRIIIKTALYTGLRESEALGLQWGDIDWASSTLHVRRAYRDGAFYDTKTKSSRRRVPIPGSLIADLKRWKLACPNGKLDLVFPNGEGNPENPSNLLHRGLYPALRRAELRQVRFHDLRHTYASHLIANGESPKIVQTLMGHSSIQVTFDIYGHMFKGSTQGVADRLDESLSSKTVANDEASEAPILQVIEKNGGSGWIRTSDQGIMSPLL